MLEQSYNRKQCTTFLKFPFAHAFLYLFMLDEHLINVHLYTGKDLKFTFTCLLFSKNDGSVFMSRLGGKKVSLNQY